jgi:hypothetical protein
VLVLLAVAIFGQFDATKATAYAGNGAYKVKAGTVYLDAQASKNILKVQYAVGGVAALVMVCYRFIFLQESEVRADDPSLLRCLHPVKCPNLFCADVQGGGQD